MMYRGRWGRRGRRGRRGREGAGGVEEGRAEEEEEEDEEEEVAFRACLHGECPNIRGGETKQMQRRVGRVLVLNDPPAWSQCRCRRSQSGAPASSRLFS
jgi:hypothetical protein